MEGPLMGVSLGNVGHHFMCLGLTFLGMWIEHRRRPPMNWQQFALSLFSASSGSPLCRDLRSLLAQEGTTSRLPESAKGRWQQ
jgi:hypothetical protein